jgi:tetratricopeptide (TPR) repeat protein
MKQTVLVFLFFALLCNSALVLAQVEPEEIKLDTDQFQDYFYEALKQKGIENYDKAIAALEQCLKLKPDEASLYFEIGKNNLALKDYEQAYNSFEKATQIDPKNKWFWAGMYDVSYQTKNYIQAIPIVQKLIEFDQDYKEDLVSLFMNTDQFDMALSLINELNETVGKSEKRELYKAKIISQGKVKNSESEITDSEQVQVRLFKEYLEANEIEKAIQSMNLVLASTKIDAKIRHRVLNEFLIFVNKNLKYSPDLEKAVSHFDSDTEIHVAKEVGKFFQNKKQWDNAQYYYEKALKSNSNDVEIHLLLMQVYVEKKQFEILLPKAIAALEIFPTQPQFYYYAGLANNQLQQFKKAKELLEMGLDYLVNDESLEINFNIQLGEAYNGLGDWKKKEMYFIKANQLLKK